LAAGFLAVAACANGGTGPARGAGDIVFASDRGGQYEVYLMNADGSDVERLTDNAAADGPCAWSPDGTRIAFQSFRDASTAPDLYVMNANGTGVVRVTNSVGWDSECAWSPDGSTLAFASERTAGHVDIYTVRVDGTGERRLTNSDSGVSPYNGLPTWSPDGTRIAFTSGRDQNRGIYLMNADGSNQVRLNSSSSYASDNPTWSPDGAKIAFAAGRVGLDTTFDIFVINVDGSGERRLVSLPTQDFYPAWSPDGTRIAFFSVRRDFSGSHALYAINADGTGVVKLAEAVWPARLPTWSRDGEQLAFASYPPWTSDICIVRADGTGFAHLMNNAARDATPLWRPAMGKG
jgi:Tol biopolymer transport system component